jgi:uncharacterized protein YqfA (UPF0365 family)
MTISAETETKRATIREAFRKLNVGPTTLAEEKAAAKAEEKRPTATITPSNFKRLNRVHELKAKKAELDAEIELHQAFIYKEMDRKGVDVLTKRNVEVVSRDQYTQVTTDWKSLEADFPEIANLYITKTKHKRVNWKKPFSLFK